MTTHHKHALSLPPPHPRQTLAPALHTFAPPSRRSSHGCKVKQWASRGSLMSISCKLESHRSIFNGERNATRIFSAFDGDSGYISRSVRKRKVVEHIMLLKAKSDLLENEEKNMLDYLYTTQYQMSGTLALSLGRVEDQNADGFSHAMFMRFQRKEDLAKYYKNSYYSGVLKEHVMPHCDGSVSVDYESEVEDDILPLFRRGEDFNYGVEFMLLISVAENAHEDAVNDALVTLHNLIIKFDSFIIQATQGTNLNLTDTEYTHGAVIRFPSLEALEIFRGSSEFKDMMRWKVQPITRKTLTLHFVVDPVGTEIM
ncbi:hypothetical protein QJS04_geneDACA000479 [Acorus gramineus]|uniref:Stress-response A/B barrel domain-containing protein n=1 Tax=Acorus gramineus TaxID=55184 RepID=A0AAV9ARZ6_ACOGR|nr:hypothetical protein QJS04_geneDACA000479 [Acorus gramineus]